MTWCVVEGEIYHKNRGRDESFSYCHLWSGKPTFSESVSVSTRPHYMSVYHKNQMTNISERAKGLSKYGKAL